MSAARFFAKRCREVIGLRELLASRCERPQHVWCRARQSAAPHGEAFGGARRCWRNLTGGFQAGGGNRDEIAGLLDVARVAQRLASGVVMTAGRLEPGKRCSLSPGEACRRVLRQRREQLARGWMKVVACRERVRAVRACLRATRAGASTPRSATRFTAAFTRAPLLGGAWMIFPMASS